MDQQRIGELLDPMMAMTSIEGQIKGSAENASLSPEQLVEQADFARSSMVVVSEDAPGTCIDERPRLGTREEHGKIEARPSVPGGPVVYGQYVAELSGYFSDSSSQDAEESMSIIADDLESKGIVLGGHDDCRANGGMGDVISFIADNPEAVKAYAERNMGDEYNEDLANESISYAIKVTESGKYDDHQEETLAHVLGDKSSNAIEKLEGEHEGRTVVRNKVRNTTVDQTKLHKLTEERLGEAEDSFVMDDWYAHDIENALATGPNAAHQKKVMAHARELVLAALAGAVPNPELHQINLSI